MSSPLLPNVTVPPDWFTVPLPLKAKNWNPVPPAFNWALPEMLIVVLDPVP